MANLSIKAEPVANVVRHLLEIVHAAGISTTVQIHVSTTLTGLSHSARGSAASLLEKGATLDFIDKLDVRPGIGCESCEIQAALAQNANNFSHKLCRYESADQIVAQLELSAQDADQQLPLYDAANERFTIGLQGSLRLAAASQAQAAALDAQQLSVREMTELTKRLARFLEQQVAWHSEFIESATTGLRDSALKQSEDFMTVITEREAELATKQEEAESRLKKKITAFEDEKAEFDARSSTVLRRENLQELRKIIKAQSDAKVSKSTTHKRWPIHGVFGASILGLGCLAAALAYNLFKNETFNWQLMAPLTGSLLGFGTLVVFYIRWLDDWFHVHSDREIGAQRAQADIIRANWLAELMFEWDKEKAIDFPSDLMRTFSQGLFESQYNTKARHPIEDISELVDRLTRVRVSAEGVEIEKKTR